MKKPRIVKRSHFLVKYDDSDLKRKAKAMAESVGRTDFYDWYIQPDSAGRFHIYATLFNCDEVVKGPLDREIK